MSRPREDQIKAAVIQFFTVLLLSLGLSLTALKALLPLQAIWPAAVMCFVFSLAFEGLFLLPLRRKWILPLAAILLLGAWGALGGGPVHTVIQLAKAAFLSLRGIPDAAAPYADAARWAVCLIFTLLAAALAWDDTLPLAVFSVVTIIALIFIFSAQERLLVYALPAAMGLLLMMAQGKGKPLSVLPLAAILAACALLLVPARPETNRQLSSLASNIRQFVEDYLLFNEFRTSFSLTSEGFQPMGDRLGGPAVPEDHLVMEVETDRTLLLKAKSYDEYTGLNWYDTLSSRRYLYASPRFATLRDELFDLNRPLAQGLVSPETLRVHMLNDGTTTLFAPAQVRTLQMESDRMVLYYNMAGELFITRDLAAGDSYTLTYLPYIAGSRATAEMVAACADLEDPHYYDVAQDYLKLPRHIQSEIYQIAHRAAGSAQTPYDQAMNLMNYLRANYNYALEVRNPPDGVDFAAWFLIGEKQGYCTYFATALTVMCRIQGIPARYVTGYVAAPDENGVAVVTGREAHAWTEIYLNGFGWLAIDGTPRIAGNNPDDPAQGNEELPPPPDTMATPEPEGGPTPTPAPNDLPPEQDQPTPTPEPTATPTPGGAEPTPAPQEEQEEEQNGQEETQEEDPPTPMPTPTPDPDDENAAGLENAASPTPPPGAAGEQAAGDPFPWWIILIVLALIAAVALRYWLTEPVRKARRKPDQGAEILFAAITALLARRNINKKPQETLHEFAARADRALSGGDLPSLWPLVNQLAAQIYGNHPADQAPFEHAYVALRGAAKPWTRWGLTLRRMLGMKG